MSWYDKELVTCGHCWARFSTPIDCLEHMRVFRAKDGELRCTPTIRRYRRMQRENPKLAELHKNKFK